MSRLLSLLCWRVESKMFRLLSRELTDRKSQVFNLYGVIITVTAAGVTWGQVWTADVRVARPVVDESASTLTDSLLCHSVSIEMKPYKLQKSCIYCRTDFTFPKTKPQSYSHETVKNKVDTNETPSFSAVSDRIMWCQIWLTEETALKKIFSFQITVQHVQLLFCYWSKAKYL